MGRYRSKLPEDLTTICYYVSDYGYGHATRSIAVIRQMLDNCTETPIRLIINSGKALSFLKESLQTTGKHQLEFRNTFSDTGYVLQKDSIAADIPRLRHQYNNDMSLFDERVGVEKNFLLESGAQLVISDISPIPVAAASKAGIESLGISNFTWYTAYRDMLELHELNGLREAYARMDHFIGLAGSAEPAWGCKCRIDTGFFCRKPDPVEVQRIRQELNPGGKGKLIFFALGMSIQVDELSSLKLWDSEDCRFIVSANMDIERPNISHIPAHYSESQNYVAAADLVITKPGWGTICEAVELNKPLVLLNRSSFYEDRHTIAAIPLEHPVTLMSWEEMQQLDLMSGQGLELWNDEPHEHVSFNETYGYSRSALTDITDYIHNLLQHVKV
ncbi:glycosyltransferase [Paenibacillus sp. Z6-24]